MACPCSHHILVLRSTRSSMDLTFMATFIAVSMGLVMVISLLNHPHTAINSISRQATKLPFQIYASLLNHLLNFITFIVQTSLGLLKHSIVGFCRYVAQLVGRFPSTNGKLVTEGIANLLGNLFRSAASHLLDLSKTVISNCVSSVFHSLTKVPQKLLKDVSPNPEGISSAKSIVSNSLASIASSFVDALKDLATRRLKNGISSVYEISLERLERFLQRIEELLKNWESKLASIREFISAILSIVEFMRVLMRVVLRWQ